MVLPGNHDIARDDALLPNGMEVKFRHIVEAARAFGIRPVEADRVTLVGLNNGSSSGALFGMNSCIGCGETRSLPESLRKDLEKLITDRIASGEASMLRSYYETLDTPAFGDSALGDLHEQASSMSVTDSRCRSAATSEEI